MGMSYPVGASTQIRKICNNAKMQHFQKCEHLKLAFIMLEE